MSSFFYALKTISQIVDIRCASTIYQAYLEARIRYKIIMWGNSVDTDRIFKL